MKHILPAALVLLWSSAASAADLWVATTGNDANSGTAAQPLRTPFEAIRRAAPGDVVHVRAGVYAGGGWIDKKGTEAQPIRVISEDGARKAVLEGGGETLRIGGGAAYLRFEGFEVRGSSDNLVHIDGGSHHIWLVDLYAHDAGPDGDVVKVNQSHHVFIDGMEAARAGKRSITTPPYQECIDFVDVDDSVVSRSWLHDNGGSILYAKGGSKRVVFERNVISGQRAGGDVDPAIGIGGWTDAGLFGGETYEAIDVVVRNNLIVGNAHGAIAVYDAKSAVIAHNLFVDNDVVEVLVKEGNGPAKASDDVRVVNNLFVDTRGKMPSAFQRQGSHGLTNLVVGDNSYWNKAAAIPASSLVPTEAGRLVADPGLSLTTFSSWSAAVTALVPMSVDEGRDTSGAPYLVLDDVRGLARSGTHHRGPYRLGATAPADAGIDASASTDAPLAESGVDALALADTSVSDSDPDDAPSTPGETNEASGCSCHTGAEHGAPPETLLGLVVASIAGRRRRVLR